MICIVWYLRKFIFAIALIHILCIEVDAQSVIDEITSETSIIIARNETPFEAQTLGGAILSDFGGIGTMLVADAQHKKKGEKAKNQFQLPDVGELIVTGFINRIKSDVNNWPETEFLEERIKKNYKSENRAQLVIIVLQQKLAGKLYSVIAKATLRNSEGDKIWNKSMGYNSYERNTIEKRDEWFENDGKLLKEEIEYASALIVSEFIKSIKEEK